MRHVLSSVSSCPVVNLHRDELEFILMFDLRSTLKRGKYILLEKLNTCFVVVRKLAHCEIKRLMKISKTIQLGSYNKQKLGFL
jgi:hypothetical protein